MNYFDNLPIDLKDIIFIFNPDHRDKMNSVMNELFFLLHKKNMKDIFNQLIEENPNILICEYCTCYFPKDREHIKKIILDAEFIFCNEECASPGEQDIRYYYRKSFRSH